MTWNGEHIAEILELDPLGAGQWRSRRGDGNMNGRSYGGQLLGQAMHAVLQETPRDRVPTMMQFLFLQGASPQVPVEFAVEVLQQGKRFTSARVSGRQDSGRVVLDAQVTCSVPLDSPSHAAPGGAPAGERPEDCATLDDADPALLRAITRLGGYSEDRKPSIDFRIPDATRQLTPATMTNRFRFWMRAARPVADEPAAQAAAFAYMSDWWMNFSAVGLHLRDLGSRKVYIASLNHAIWMHGPVRVDRWLHVESVSPCAMAGRGLAIGAVHDEAGRPVASITQECLLAYSG